MAKKTKIKVKKSLWGKFNLPFKVGQTVSIESKLAEEIIESNHGVLVGNSAADKAAADKAAADKVVK